jgi:hypothetical protein
MLGKLASRLCPRGQLHSQVDGNCETSMDPGDHHCIF